MMILDDEDIRQVLDNLTYEPCQDPLVCFDIWIPEGSSEAKCQEKEVYEDDLVQWLDNPPWTMANDDGEKAVQDALRLIINPVGKLSSWHHVNRKRRTILKIREKFNFPSVLLHAFEEFQNGNSRSSTDGQRSYCAVTSHSHRLAVSHNSNGLTYAYMASCDDDVPESCKIIRKSPRLVLSPLFLPCMIFESYLKYITDEFETCEKTIENIGSMLELCAQDVSNGVLPANKNWMHMKYDLARTEVVMAMENKLIASAASFADNAKKVMEGLEDDSAFADFISRARGSTAKLETNLDTMLSELDSLRQELDVVGARHEAASRMIFDVLGHSRDLKRQTVREEEDMSLSKVGLTGTAMAFIPSTCLGVLLTLPFVGRIGTLGRSPLGKGIWTYWAVTLPMTMAAPCVWWLWKARQKRVRFALPEEEPRGAGIVVSAPK